MFALIQDVAEQAPTIKPMTTLGWVFMICSVGFVISLAAWCYRKVLTAPPIE